MSKRQAEFQIHNQPMTEAENRAASMMNNQAPAKATPAQLARRKIREAKGSGSRRRIPGTSPGPTANPFSHTQSNPNFLSGVNSTATTPAFGANGVNGAQQPSFAAPSSNTFDFTASTGMNPFAASGPSNPFSTQNSSMPFGQKDSAGEQRDSIFDQTPVSQSSSNPFSTTGSFSFGQSSGLNNSFPQPHNNSLFSKPTPAPSSFTFGSNPSLPAQTPSFGVSTPKSAADNDISMGTSGESPFKRSAKSAASDQSSETKPAAPAFGGSTLFSFNPTRSDMSQGPKTLTSQSAGSMPQPERSTAEQIQPAPTSEPGEKQAPLEQSTKPSAPVFNFFPKPKEPEKGTSENSDAQPARIFNPFTALKTADTETTIEEKNATLFSFGAPPSKTEDKGRTQEQKAPGGAPSNPFQSLQSSDAGGQPAQLKASMLFNSSQTPNFPLSEKPQTSALFAAVQSPKPAGAENPQNPTFNPVQHLQPINGEQSAQEAPKSSTSASNLFLPSNQTTDSRSHVANSPTKSTSSHVSQTLEHTYQTSEKEKAEPSGQQTLFTPGSGSIFKGPQSTKISGSLFELNNTQRGNAVSDATEQSEKPNRGIDQNGPSHTSHLFAESLARSSTPTSKSMIDSRTSQPDAPRPERSPTKPNSVTEKKVGNLLHSTIVPDTATRPFMVKVKSHGASNVPQQLDNDGFADFDKSYRLRSLNERFKSQIAELDPDEHDFEPVVRFYAAQRASIGYPLGGLYHRVKAGEKRKTEEAGRVEEAPNAAKRAKLVESATAFDQPIFPPNLASSAITSLSTTPRTGAVENESDRSTVNPNIPSSSTAPQPATTTSNTSNVFKSILSSSTQSPFATTKPLPSNVSPSESASLAPSPKPAVQQTRPSPFSTFTSADSENSKTQTAAQSNSNTEVHPAPNGAVSSSASSAAGASLAQKPPGESSTNASPEGSGHSGRDEESESEESPPKDMRGAHKKEEDDEEDEEENGNDDDIQTAMAKSHAKAKNPFESSSDPRSLFNRITRPDETTEGKGSQADTASSVPLAANNSVFSPPPGSGLFGSRPNTPSHELPKPFGDSIFSNTALSTPNGDNTWKPGSAIKFSAPSSAPAVNITPATPLAKANGDIAQTPFSTFSAAASTNSKPTDGNGDSTPKSSISSFGVPSATAQSAAGPNAETSKPYSALFGDAFKKTAVNQSSAAQVGWSFGGPNKAGVSPLLGPSDASSAVTSRTTSPGLTDNESAAESGTDDSANDPQPDFMATRPGEENEEVLFELRTKALEFMSEKELSASGSKEEAGWKTRGLGPLRVLKNSDTGRARIVMRSEPSAGVVVNSPLIQDNKYDASASGKEAASLKTGIYMNGKLKNWVFKIKNMKIANELVDCLKEHEPKSKERDTL